MTKKKRKTANRLTATDFQRPSIFRRSICSLQNTSKNRYLRGWRVRIRVNNAYQKRVSALPLWEEDGGRRQNNKIGWRRVLGSCVYVGIKGHRRWEQAWFHRRDRMSPALHREKLAAIRPARIDPVSICVFRRFPDKSRLRW